MYTSYFASDLKKYKTQTFLLFKNHVYIKGGVWSFRQQSQPLYIEHSASITSTSETLMQRERAT